MITIKIKNIKNQPKKVFNTVARWLLQEFPYDSRFTSVAAIVELLKERDDTLVAFLGDKLIGTISFAEKDDLRSRHKGWITDFVVAKRQRGKGHGSLLLQAIVEHARGTGRKELFLYTPDQESFYERRGWVTIKHQTHSCKAIVVMTRKF